MVLAAPDSIVRSIDEFLKEANSVRNQECLQRVLHDAAAKWEQDCPAVSGGYGLGRHDTYLSVDEVTEMIAKFASVEDLIEGIKKVRNGGTLPNNGKALADLFVKLAGFLSPRPQANPHYMHCNVNVKPVVPVGSSS